MQIIFKANILWNVFSVIQLRKRKAHFNLKCMFPPAALSKQKQQNIVTFYSLKNGSKNSPKNNQHAGKQNIHWLTKPHKKCVTYFLSSSWTVPSPNVLLVLFLMKIHNCNTYILSPSLLNQMYIIMRHTWTHLHTHTQSHAHSDIHAYIREHTHIL